MRKTLLLLGALLGFTASALAQTYPWTNPTYIPTATLAPTAYSAPAAPTMVLNGVATVSLRVSGTCTSLSGTLQATNDGSNWTVLPLVPVGGGAAVSPSAPITAVGFWRADTSGFTSVRFNMTALTASCTVAMAGSQAIAYINSDPCQDPILQKQSAAINLGASATTAVVAASTGKSIYVCNFEASAVGTNPTLTFKYGTQTTTACDTGAVNLTGAMIPAAADGMIMLEYGGTVMTSPASNQLCITTGATTSIQGVLNYIQQ